MKSLPQLQQTKRTMRTDFNIKFNFNKFINLEEGLDWTTEMPNYWLCYFKIDGDTCELDSDLNFKGTAEVYSPMQSFDTILHYEYNSNDEIIIPKNIQSNVINLKPIQVPKFVKKNGISDLQGYSGCIVVFTNNEYHPEVDLVSYMQNYIQKSLNDLVAYLANPRENIRQYLNMLKKDIEYIMTKKNKQKLSFWDKFNSDCKVDTSIWIFSSDELLQYKNVSLIKYWGVDNPWKLIGEITIDPSNLYENHYHENKSKAIDSSKITVNV